MWFGEPDVAKMAKGKNITGLIKALRYFKNRRIRLDALKALGQLKDPIAIKPIMSICEEEKNTEFQIASIHALGLFGDSPAAETATAIKRIGTSIVNELISELKSPIRTYSGDWELIGDHMGYVTPDPKLNEAYERRQINEKHYIVKALGLIGDPRAVIPMIHSQALGVSSECITNALKNIGNPALEVILKNYNPPTTNLIIRALIEFGDERALDPLYEALFKIENSYSSEENRFRQTIRLVVDTLKRFDRPVVEELVKTLSSDIFETKRARAAEILGIINDSSAVNSLINSLSHDEERCVRLSAAKALGMLRSPYAVESLIIAMKESKLVKQVADALGMIGDASATVTLVNSLERFPIDSSERVSITNALKSITGQDLGQIQSRWQRWLNN